MSEITYADISVHSRLPPPILRYDLVIH